MHILRERAGVIMTMSYIREKRSSIITRKKLAYVKVEVAFASISTYTEQMMKNILGVEEK